jgi:hypothetical protein
MARRTTRQPADLMTAQRAFRRSKTAFLEKYSQPAISFLLMAQEFSFFVFDMKAVTAHMGNREERVVSLERPTRLQVS